MRTRGTIVGRASSLVIVMVAVGLAIGPAPAAAARAGGDDALVVTAGYRLRAFRWNHQHRCVRSSSATARKP